ncbi:MAG: phosphotransferase, partial [Chloroflexi bacterium]|nr:phosphotransferase [Chloroflexota bacterium]
LTPYQPGSRQQLAAAARALGRFHRTTAPLTLPGCKPWAREHRIEAMRDTLAEALADLPDSPERPDALAMLAAAEELSRAPLGSWVESLPSAIIHGDYTPANVLFRGDSVGGIFDFDWVSRQPRVIDLGEALIFFAFTRRDPIDPDDIWSLVQGWAPDLDAARAFLAAYQAEWPLTREEARALPYFMRETWLGVRIRAMRKVPTEERLRILTQDGLPPLRWLERSVELLAGLALTTATG